MSKPLSIALILSIATVAVPTAQADTPMGARIIAQENARQVVLQPAAKTPTERIVAQERGRKRDARLFGPWNARPVLVAGPADEFDFGDAGIGGAVTLAFALLAAAGVAVRKGSRRRASSEASA